MKEKVYMQIDRMEKLIDNFYEKRREIFAGSIIVISAIILILTL